MRSVIDTPPCDASSSVRPLDLAATLSVPCSFSTASFTFESPSGAVRFLKMYWNRDGVWYADQPDAGRSNVALSPLAAAMRMDAPTTVGLWAGSTTAGSVEVQESEELPGRSRNVSFRACCKWSVADARAATTSISSAPIVD